MKARTTSLIAAAALVAASAALASCERDEAGTQTTPTFDGDRAYCVVKINDVNTSSTRATDGGFENGSESEYAVNDAHFYFYDSYGELVVETSALNPSGSVPDPANENIDWGSSTVITLEGLSSKNYPSYVVTVINRPDGFSAPNELSDFVGLLASALDEGIGEPGGLTMSTSSYVNGDETYYFATPVTEENFSTEPLTEGGDAGYTDADGADVVPIDIYVERLAAKARLAMGEGVTGTDVNGETLYPITVEMIDEDEGTAAETVLYVRINGWGLNGTARGSNMVKTIDTGWTEDDLGFAWNDAANFRSYWGESFNYGIVPAGGYPTSATDGDYDDVNGGYYDGTSYSEWLEYRSWSDLTGEIGGETYCGENTNTAGDPTQGTFVIISPQSSAITNILVSATVCDEDGQPLDLVRHDGVLYTEADFLAYAMGHNTALYYRTDTDPETYELCGPDYVELVNYYDGHVRVYFTDEYAEDTFYTVTVTGEDASGNPTYDVTATYDYEEANQYLDDHFNTLYSSDANAYRGGDMYYNIPIQHLNNDYDQTYTDNDGEEQTLVLEGNYGVVRNHIYAVTITGIENLGRGVFDPDEIIIPQIDEDTYSLLAQINILSWKVVEQGVTL